MPGEGSMMFMIQSLRNNKALLRGKRLFKKERSFLQKDNLDLHESKEGIKSTPITAKQRKEIRFKIRKEQRKDYLRKAIFIIILFPLITSLGYFLLKDFSFGFEQTTPVTNLKAQKEIMALKKYEFYIADGDLWLGKKNYYNAIFQYRNALEIRPLEYEVQYRLLYTYGLSCENESLNCSEGNELMNLLQSNYPEKEELFELGLNFQRFSTTAD